MADKLQNIMQLVEDAAVRATDGPQQWKEHLKFASGLYKYRFEEQLLIREQRPDATACAAIEVWNKMKRWVNRGAKGIALIDGRGAKLHLKYVFDVSDTHSGGNRELPVWRMEPRYQGRVIEKLSESTGPDNDAGDFAEKIIGIAASVAADYYGDYCAELLRFTEGVPFEGMDEYNIEAIFRKLVQNSAAYCLLTRCGFDADQYFTGRDFWEIIHFNSFEAAMQLGAAVSTVSEMLLRNVERTVKEQSRRDILKTSEKEKESDGHGRNHLHEEGRLSDPRPDAAGGAGTGIRKIWSYAQELFERASEGDVCDTHDVGQTQRAPGGNRLDGAGTDRPDRISDGESRGSHRGDEGFRSDEMDGPDEQSQALGGGAGALRTDIQLKWHDRETEDSSLPFFHSSAVINKILRETPHLRATKLEIAEYFALHDDEDERMEYIQSIFNVGPTELMIDDEKRAGYEAYQNVLHLWEGSFDSKTSQGYYYWGVIAGHFSSMMLMGEYLTHPADALPSVGQQISMIERAEDKKSSAFLIPQGAIDAILRQGSGVHHGKYRIYQQFRRNETTKENADFLKHEYGTGGRGPALTGTDLDEWHDPKGIRITRDPDVEVRLTWPKVAMRIGELITADRYLNKREKENLPAYLREMEERVRQIAESRATAETSNVQVQPGPNDFDDIDPVSIRESLKRSGIVNGKVIDPDALERDPFIRMAKADAECARAVEPDRKNAYYALSLGATVYLGADEYEILSFEGGTVQLQDINFPLFVKELPQVDFDRMSRENPLNDRLIAPEPNAEEKGLDGAPGAANLDELAGHISVTWDGEPVTIEEKNPEDREKPYVEFNMELPESNEGEPPDTSNHTEEPPQDRIPAQPRVNFRITDDSLGVGGPKTKFAWNIAAIRLLKTLEKENRLANAEEQEVLSRYAGWGGIPQAFDRCNASWTKEYDGLKELLDEEEYTSARATTLNAYYTSPVVIKAMYAWLERIGFRTGNILEPGCGPGNFLGLLPDSMVGSELYGVELDSITGRIAGQLYQKARIAVQGFENTELPDSFFDLAVGNVPFGGYGVADKKYDKYHFHIHDYFFAKSLDKVRPGGLIVFITSKGTMDKQNPAVRKYIAQRAELLGAVRLPNNAFKANAGTEVTSDILFLQKRDCVIDIEAEWVHLGRTEDGIPLNSYFAEHPEMMLGKMSYNNTMYGSEKDTTCEPFENMNLAEQLDDALSHMHAEATERELDDAGEEDGGSIPADPNVRNFSYAIADGNLYYRVNSRMDPVKTSVTAQGRIRGMIGLRDCVRKLMEYQAEDYSDEAIREQQQELNRLYDAFTLEYGLINSRGNSLAFSDDSSYYLLCSLEVLDEDGNLDRKADMFTKRTIRQRSVVTHVDTAVEALAVSIAEKARVDMEFMQSLTGLSEPEIAKDLEGVVFQNPEKPGEDGRPRYETADEYLSGNVREKLRAARQFAQMRPDLYRANVAALEAVQPKDLDASEIEVRLGATWVPTDVVKEFIFETLETPNIYRRNIDVFYSTYTANWNVRGKNDDRSDNVKSNVTYGTTRVNAYRIIEDTLNLRDVRIYDKMTVDGKETRVLNKTETAVAQQKQEAVKDAFREWIWRDPERRERLCRLYNDKFNSIRPREYDGSHITFPGMNPEIRLRKHQVDAIARILYGGNTLLAHCVGAGKTFEMVAAAMEAKRLGLCNKNIIAVPNYLTGQMAGEFLELYPSANILVTTKKDFEAQKRKKFCARIATGDYDAVIIGHSQFEKIPVSHERQVWMIEEQIDEITGGIQELKDEKGERYSIKQLEHTKKSLKLKLDRLNADGRKDNVVTFEELGVDRLFVDEADGYKNLFLYTKMRNVAGLSVSDAQKATDMYMKCRYLDELTDGRGIVFATGTPISNSIAELYTMQRYLQHRLLREKGLEHFDCWVSTFGETVAAIELSPEGTGYRLKTRFARFYNLSELMMMFREAADIKTADMLNLPVPKDIYHTEVVKPSKFQKDMVAELSERAERVRNRTVAPNEDNMLLITNDGRKLALDQRLMNPMLPDDEGGKTTACADIVHRFWREQAEQRLTQLVFCDLSTPKHDGSFNVYDDLRQKLISKGMPAGEIAFIHDANTDVRKKELFAKVRSGQVRVLMGSTFKMGAGMNVQNRLIASHDLDCPWRPRDLEQRLGRTVRQGNMNPEVHIFRYVTEGTFDAYSWQTVENKQRFISQIMTSKSPVRSIEDIDGAALSYAEVKALASGNPLIKEKMDLDIQVSKLKLLKENYLSQRYALEDKLIKLYPEKVRLTEKRIEGYEKDIALYMERRPPEPAEDGKFAGMTIEGVLYIEKAKAGTAILEACARMTSPEPWEMGKYMGFTMLLSFDSYQKQYEITLRGTLSHKVALGNDIYGNITRLNNILSEMSGKLQTCREQLLILRQQMGTAGEQLKLPFEKEEELRTKSARLAELNAVLNLDKSAGEAMLLPDEPEASDGEEPMPEGEYVPKDEEENEVELE